MTKLTQFLATCLLVFSITAVAFADGGNTQGTGGAPPVPPCTQNCSGAEASTTTPPAEDSSVDVVATAEVLVAWLAASIL